ncbi:MAG: tandem-95 repeat protein, partial [Cytophagales bacterium]
PFSDPDGVVTVTSQNITNPTGTFAVNSVGGFSFVPNGTFAGIAQFTVSGCDMFVCSNAIVTISVTGINNPPTVIDNAIIGVTEDVEFCGTISGYSDVDNSPVITAGIFTIAGVGVVTINGNGSFCLSPEPNNFGGPKLIPFEVCDPFACVTANLVFTVIGVNDPPLAVNNVEVNIPVNTSFSGTITGFSDVDHLVSDLTVSTVVGGLPKKGTITLNPDGTYLYIPNSGVSGKDTITYQVCDKGTPQLCAAAQLFITINPVVTTTGPSNPTFTGANATGFEDVEQTIRLKDFVITNPNDSVVFSIVSGTFHGSITGFNPKNGLFTYNPTLNYYGKDTLNYEICISNSGITSCTSASFIINLPPVNDRPVAVRDVKIFAVGQTETSGNALLNDTDVDGDTLKSIVQTEFTTSNGGLFQINSLGEFIYTKAANFSGLDSVVYVITDKVGAKDTAYIVFDVPATAVVKSEFVSEGFSPNGDGSNDLWQIKSPADSPKTSVVVYNRWGNLVYKSDEYQNDWNGKANQGLKIGEGVPDGTYYYVVDFNNGAKPQIGFITITR